MDTNNTAKDSGVSTTDRAQEKHSIQTYVSDMLALERHIAQPLARQLQIEDTARYADAIRVITQIKGVIDEHVAALERHLGTSNRRGVSRATEVSRIPNENPPANRKSSAGFVVAGMQ
jgi:hypothetical protein